MDILEKKNISEEYIDLRALTAIKSGLNSLQIYWEKKKLITQFTPIGQSVLA